MYLLLPCICALYKTEYMLLIPTYLTRGHLCRTACRMSCPPMQTMFLRRRQRLPSNRWTRVSSQEVRWIGMNWRGVTSCCGFIVFSSIFYLLIWRSNWKILHLTKQFSSSSAFLVLRPRPLERGWRKTKDGSVAQPKVRLKQEVVSCNNQQQRGQRIVVPVKKLFAREKRPYGLGMVGRLTNRTYRKRIDSFVKRQIEDMDDHR